MLDLKGFTTLKCVHFQSDACRIVQVSRPKQKTMLTDAQTTDFEELMDAACAACDEGDIQELRKCVEQDLKLLVCRSSYLINYVFKAGLLDLCKAFLDLAQKAGLDIFPEQEEPGETALHIAIAKDRVDLVELLAFFGHDVQHCSFSFEEYDIEHIEFNGSLGFESSEACDYAVFCGSYNVCEYYLQSFSDENRTDAVCMAARVGYRAICELVLHHGDPLDSQFDFINFSPVICAAEYGHYNLIELLLEYGVNKDVQDFEGMTAVHRAAFAGQNDAVSYLLRCGADCEIEDEDGDKPYQLGCFACFAEIGCSLSSLRSHRHKTDLMTAEELDADMTKLFERHNDEFSNQLPLIGILRQRMRCGYCFTINDGLTSIFRGLNNQLTRQAAADFLLALVAEGALLAVVEPRLLLKSVTAAFDRNQWLLFEQLLQFMDRENKKLIVHICSNCQHPSPLRFLTLLLQHYNILCDVPSIINSAVDISGNTPLMLAVSKMQLCHDPEQRLEMVKLLLYHGANVHHANKIGETVVDVCRFYGISESALRVKQELFRIVSQFVAAKDRENGPNQPLKFKRRRME